MDVLKAGTTFAGRYEVVRIISAGGMGVVYEVVHKETQRRRALKVMLPSALADDDMRARFQREAVVTATVESEHIVEVFDAGVEPSSGAPFLVMEMLRGEDLGSRLQKRGRLSSTDAIEILTQIARGLDRTHAAGIVHRDLKPENIFLATRDDGSPRVKILDFGIAKLVSRTQGKATRSLGTPLYMAPEQITGVAADIGPAADLYALAHLAFGMLAGQPYFQPEASATDNVLALLFHIAQGAPEPATKRAAAMGAELPKGLDPWFTRATHMEPAKRFATANELVRALADGLRGSEPARPPLGSSSSGDAVPARTGVSEDDGARGAAVPDLATEPTLPVGAPVPWKLRSATEKSLDVAPGNTGDQRESFSAAPPASSRTVADVGRGASRARWGVVALGGVALAGLAIFAATQGGSSPGNAASSGAAVAPDVVGSAQGQAPGGGVDAPIVEPTTAPLPSASASTTISSGFAVPSTSATAPSVPKTQRTATGVTVPVPAPTTTVWVGPRR